MVSWKHSGRPVNESSARQSVRSSAARGDRARRVAAANRRIARYALPVTASACLASALIPVLGGPGSVGLTLLVAGAAIAGATVLAARFAPRVLHDGVVAQLDRAAALDGSLRSAYWFATHDSSTTRAADRTAPLIASHLEEAASRAAGVDWTRVYSWPLNRARTALVVACIVAAVGLSFKPLPRLSRPAVQARHEGGGAPETSTTPADAPGAPVPQILEGIKALRSGRKPSEEQLSAIGHALDTARHDPAARKRIEGEVNASDSKGTDPRQSSSSDSESAAWSNDYQNGFEMSDLDWAYQEAMARGRTDEAPHPEPGGDVTPPSGTSDPSSKGRPAEPAAAGELTGSPIEGDTRGRPADFSSLLRGTQHATGHSGAPDQAKDDGRAARLAAALRTEVVHANSEITLPNLDRPASRRATTASSVPPAAPGASEHVAYDRSHAAQPPAVPDARRPLLRGYFLRTDEPTSAVKRP